MQGWRDNQQTSNYIILVENFLKSDHADQRDHSLKYPKKAIYTIKGNFKDTRKQGTYAHELVALEFLT